MNRNVYTSKYNQTRNQQVVDSSSLRVNTDESIPQPELQINDNIISNSRNVLRNCNTHGTRRYFNKTGNNVFVEENQVNSNILTVPVTQRDFTGLEMYRVLSGSIQGESQSAKSNLKSKRQMLSSLKEISFNLISRKGKKFDAGLNVSKFEIIMENKPKIKNKEKVVEEEQDQNVIQTIRIFIDRHQFLKSKNLELGYELSPDNKQEKKNGFEISPVKIEPNKKKIFDFLKVQENVSTTNILQNKKKLKQINKIINNLNLNITNSKEDIDKFKQQFIKDQGLIDNIGPNLHYSENDNVETLNLKKERNKFDNLKKYHISTISILPIYPQIKRVEIDLKPKLKNKNKSKSPNQKYQKINQINETTSETLIKPIMNRWNENNRITKEDALLKNYVNYKEIVYTFNLDKAIPNQDVYYLVKQKDGKLIKTLIRPTQTMDLEGVVKKFKETDPPIKGKKFINNNNNNNSCTNHPFFVLKKEDIEEMYKEINFGRIDNQRLKEEYMKEHAKDNIVFSEELCISKEEEFLIESEKIHLKNVLKNELEKNILNKNDGLVPFNNNSDIENAYINSIITKNYNELVQENILNFYIFGEPRCNLQNIYTFKRNSDTYSKDNYDSNRDQNDFGQTTPIGLLTEKYFLYAISKWAKFSFPVKQESFQTFYDQSSLNKLRLIPAGYYNEVILGMSNFSLSIERIKMKMNKKMFGDIGIVGCNSNNNSCGISRIEGFNSIGTNIGKKDTKINKLNNRNANVQHSRQRMNEKSNEILKRNIRSKSKTKRPVVNGTGWKGKNDKEEEKSI